MSLFSCVPIIHLGFVSELYLDSYAVKFLMIFVNKNLLSATDLFGENLASRSLKIFVHSRLVGEICHRILSQSDREVCCL